MLKITILADVKTDDVFGFKECLAMHLEQFGASHVIDVQAVPDEQIEIRKDKKK